MLPATATPLPVGDLFDQAAALCLRNAAFVTAVGGPPILLASIVSAALALQWGRDVAPLWFPVGPQPAPDELLQALPPVLALGGVNAVGYGFATVALTLALGRLYRGQDPPLAELHRSVLRKVPALLGLVLVWLLWFVGFVVVLVLFLLAVVVAAGGAAVVGPGAPDPLGVLLIIPALIPVLAWLYILIRWSLAVAALMLEDRGPLSALGRSWDVVRGRVLRVSGLLLLFSLAGAILSSLPSFVADVLAGDPRLTGPEAALALDFVISGVAQLIVLPPTVAGSVLLFEDLRRLRDLRERAEAGVPRPWLSSPPDDHGPGEPNRGWQGRPPPG